MQEDNVIISKGTYDYYQQGAFLRVKDYIVTIIDGKKCLLLRFQNDSEVTINRIKIRLSTFDSNGKLLSKKSHVYESLNIKGYEEFALKSGILVNDDMSDFRVNVEFVTSGAYKFYFKHGLAIQKYDPRGYKTIILDRTKRGSFNITRTSNVSSSISKSVATLVFVLIIVALIITNAKNQSIFGKKAEEPEIINNGFQIELINE